MVGFLFKKMKKDTTILFQLFGFNTLLSEINTTDNVLVVVLAAWTSRW